MVGSSGCSDSDNDSNGNGGQVQTITTDFLLQNSMRKLWTDHVTWTRVFLIDAVAGLPSTPNSTQRLLQNQVDIGDAIKPFYGDAAGNQLTKLLKTHITGAAAVVAAAKAGDQAKLDAANKAWYANADEIAKFLADANPHLALADLQAMMKKHLDQTEAEAAARLTGKYQAEVVAYDAVVDHILMMADALTDGIAAQFPLKVGDSTKTIKNQQLHLAMRDLWEDHVTWTRVVIMDAVAGLPDTDVAVARLMQNQVDIGNANKPFYGNTAGGQLTALLKQHIALAIEIVTDAKQGQRGRANTPDPTTQWYRNADQIAEFLAKANPNYDVNELKAMMKEHLDTTLAEATARLEGKWAADVKAYDVVVDHILKMADFLSDGLVQQFPNRF